MGLALGMDGDFIQSLMVVLTIDYIIIVDYICIVGSALVGISCDHG